MATTLTRAGRLDLLTGWVAAGTDELGLVWPGLPPHPKKVVVGVDTSLECLDAAAWAKRLGTQIHLVTGMRREARPPYEGISEQESDQVMASARLVLHNRRAREHRIHADGFHAILEVAAQSDADAIAVGHSAKGLMGRSMLGSVSEAAVHQTQIPTLVARGAPGDGVIVAGIGADDGSAYAAAWATALAIWLDRPLILAHAERGTRAPRHHRLQGAEAESRVVGTPAAKGLMEIAGHEHASLIVVGHGRRPGWLGSSAIRLLREAPASVFVARPWPV